LFAWPHLPRARGKKRRPSPGRAHSVTDSGRVSLHLGVNWESTAESLLGISSITCTSLQCVHRYLVTPILLLQGLTVTTDPPSRPRALAAIQVSRRRCPDCRSGSRIETDAFSFDGSVFKMERVGATAETLQKAFRERIVARFGVLKVLVTDNGTAGTECEKVKGNLRGGETKSGKGSLGPSQAFQPSTKTMESKDRRYRVGQGEPPVKSGRRDCGEIKSEVQWPVH